MSVLACILHFLEGQWKVLHRQPIYEKDRIDPVDSTAQLTLEPQLLASMPEGYRHLAYVMPMRKGGVVEELDRRGDRWLAGGALER